MTAADHRMYWDLLKTLHWIRTRDLEHVEAMWDMKKENETPLTLSSPDAVSDSRSLLVLLAEYDFEDDGQPALQEVGRISPEIEESGMIGPSGALNYLLSQVRSRRIRMTAIECHRHRVKQIPLPPAELNDLEFRMTPDHRTAKVGLWSRSRNTLMWRSPQFLRTDVIRVWPARAKRRAAVSGAILRHLQAIMTSAAPLTRAEAQRRCLAEVPDAYPEAFKKAWALLDCCCKRGRGRQPARALSQESSE